MSVKIISLSRSLDRRAEFVRSNPELKYDFFDAVDGRALSKDQLEDPNYFIHPLPFSGIGAYGLALSHLQLWEECIAGGAPLTIAEDDAVFRDDFAEQSLAVISEMPEGWDIILWGWNFDSILSVHPMKDVSPVLMLCNQDDLRRGLLDFKALRVPVHPLPLDKCFGTVAYTISPAGAQKFRDLCFPMIDVKVFFPFLNREIGNTGIDIAMNNIYSCTGSYVCFPPLVVTANDHATSTVQSSR